MAIRVEAERLSSSYPFPTAMTFKEKVSTNFELGENEDIKWLIREAKKRERAGTQETHEEPSEITS